MRRRLEFAAGLVLALLPYALQAQAPAAGIYRIYQGTAEVGRESFRRYGDTLEQEAVVPVANLRVSSRTTFARGGALTAFSMTVSNATGDSAMGSYTVTVTGDTLRITSQLGGPARTLIRTGKALLVLPPQSVFSFVELARRAGGRDTTVLVLVAGADTLLPAEVRFRADSLKIGFAGLEILLRRSGGAFPELSVPVQRVRAVLAGVNDSLPPLSGLRRPPSDYSAPAGAGWTAEEVRVPAGAAPDTFSLACTLTLPRAGRPPFPAAVTITGSGGQTRDSDLWPMLTGYRLFGQAAERLGAVGIAVLRCDDRSTGGSGGRADAATTADLAEDTRAQLRWLRARRDIDGKRLALIGHSEGGVIGPLLAAQERGLAALVIMAGPAKDGTEILVDQARWPILAATGLSEETRAARMQEAELAVRSDSLPAMPWLRWFRHYDPLKAARLVRQPTLILHGALDQQVSAGQADTLAATMRASGNRRVEVRVFPGLNHLFLPSATDGSPMEYASLRETQVPAEVLDTLVRWLAGVLR